MNPKNDWPISRLNLYVLNMPLWATVFLQGETAICKVNTPTTWVPLFLITVFDITARRHTLPWFAMASSYGKDFRITALLWGNPPVNVSFSIIRSFGVFFCVNLNNLLVRQSNCQCERNSQVTIRPILFVVTDLKYLIRIFCCGIPILCPVVSRNDCVLEMPNYRDVTIFFQCILKKWELRIIIDDVDQYNSLLSYLP